MTADPPCQTAISSHAGGSALTVTITPRATKSGLGEAADGSLRVSVTAPPVEGAANAALLRLLADALDIPRSRLHIVSGTSSRRKRVAVDGMAPDELGKRLEGLLRESRRRR